MSALPKPSPKDHDPLLFSCLVGQPTERGTPPSIPTEYQKTPPQATQSPRSGPPPNANVSHTSTRASSPGQLARV